MEVKEWRDEQFIKAIRQNRAGMFRVARMMLRNDSDAEEAVAEATMKAYAYIGSLRSWDAVRPWLMRITVNTCHKVLRRRKRELPTDEQSVFDHPQEERERADIWNDVEKLDEKYSVPLTMFYEEEMSLAEIAQALKLTRGTVSSRLTRGRQKLKAMLEKEEALLLTWKNDCIRKKSCCLTALMRGRKMC